MSVDESGLESGIDPAFDRDKFLLREKLLTIHEKYYVWDETGKTILFVERPAHALRQFASLFVAIVFVLAGFVFTIMTAIAVNDFSRSELLGFAVALSLGITVIVGGVLLKILIEAKRHVVFYRDDTKKERLLEIRQDRKFYMLNATYTVLSDRGEALARFRKNYFYNLFRKRWYCTDPDGEYLFTVLEDSLALALLRRFLGTCYGLLRANFIFAYMPEQGDREEVIGEFNRKFTLLDRYVLDLTADRGRSFDRRICLAMGVLLDSGERR